MQDPQVYAVEPSSDDEPDEQSKADALDAILGIGQSDEEEPTIATQQEMTLAEPEEAHVDPAPTKPERREKGELERQVREVCNDFVRGTWTPKDGVKTLTPHYVAKEVHARHPEQRKPSPGAVAAIFSTWDHVGYATVSTGKPYGFTGYTAAARNEGLSALKAAHREASAEATREQEHADLL